MPQNRNNPPTAPTINCPPQNSITYNRTPRVLVTLGAATDAQTLVVSYFTPSATENLTSGRKIVLMQTKAMNVPSNMPVKVKTKDPSGAASPEVTTTIWYRKQSFTDETLAAGVTPIRSEHISELRTMVDNVRAYYGLPGKAWAEPVTPGVTSLAGWKDHVLELRKAMEDVAAVINGWDTISTVNNVTLSAWIDIPVNKPTVDVMNQLRETITLL